ncbi:MAG TPA: hypothetical protein VGN80_19485 [Devosiaceae bacterium]|jgi:hypothetical protein|nr:hypothetical protein [Devosiaceae bacterium]
MTFRNSLTLALAALTLSTTMATALVAPVPPDPNRCHDETTMRIGTLVDGQCQSPEIPAALWGGYDMSWGGSEYPAPLGANPYNRTKPATTPGGSRVTVSR